MDARSGGMDYSAEVLKFSPLERKEAQDYIRHHHGDASPSDESIYLAVHSIRAHKAVGNHAPMRAVRRSAQSEQSAHDAPPKRTARRTENPRIWEADLGEPIDWKIDWAAWQKHLNESLDRLGRELADERQRRRSVRREERERDGAERTVFEVDPWTVTPDKIRAVANKIRRAIEKSSLGYEQLSFAGLAEAKSRCAETVRKAVRWLEAHGLLGTVRVFSWNKRIGARQARNLYTVLHAREPDGAAVRYDGPWSGIVAKGAAMLCRAWRRVLESGWFNQRRSAKPRRRPAGRFGKRAAPA